MHSRFYSFVQAFKSSRQWTPLASASSRPRISQFVCQTCRHKFSTSTIFRKIAYGSRRNFASAAKKTKETPQRRYPTDLLIYDAGDTRTTFVAFWKAVALLQFGTCVVFITPMLYKNENQPNEYIRSFQAIGVTALAAIPCAVLAYITAPFVSQIHMEIPLHVTHSLNAVRAFARNPPPTTRLRFLTLRIFPIGKATTTYVSELRALPSRRFRFANLERVAGPHWAAEQRKKSLGKKVWDLVNEPRWKFYVREGHAYTMRPGVPGVWEEIARGIGEQTNRVEAKGDEKVVSGSAKRLVKGGVVGKRPIRVAERKVPDVPIRRQTSRSSMK
ncbi:hypothetical protein P280DRAFT_421512 [Massarina eburnea CBS 473.64]|uniref:Uncharacterized protein n=1 Tax=Massarina eburnea CBS 473.64 TaxID=1395130 RepID=A0A6A6S753_9PLEO|nr:hypothetical protein P280DRAFT_421512 [Massarina eburnea CBS 473.64]